MKPVTSVLHAVKNLHLMSGQPRGRTNLIRRILVEHIGVFVGAFTQRTAVKQFQEAQLKHVCMQCVGLVKAVAEAVKSLIRKSGDKVNMDMRVSRSKQASDVFAELVQIGVPRHGFKRFGVKALKSGFKLK